MLKYLALQQVFLLDFTHLLQLLLEVPYVFELCIDLDIVMLRRGICAEGTHLLIQDAAYLVLFILGVSKTILIYACDQI